MSATSAKAKNAYNKRAYIRKSCNIRKDSLLGEKLDDYLKSNNISFNELVIHLLEKEIINK